ncbi:hypothetical protein [Caballeronia sp. ATUFL_M2_KS44]|uniref:hypothetical protein n=1 Tax=Caballeronia sp. ATUFL_M2_KS44 TaxID=2921767 RepID=UPI00202826FB|nr:hypothetical protein [Caballeronia sp. ATUFL_M2_KS44]
MKSKQPIFQIRVAGLTGLWRDVDKKAYDLMHPNQRRIVHVEPPPRDRINRAACQHRIALHAAKLAVEQGKK